MMAPSWLLPYDASVTVKSMAKHMAIKKCLHNPNKTKQNTIKHVADIWGSFCSEELALIIAWIRNYIHYNVWDEIAYLCPTVNGPVVKRGNG